LSTNFFIKKNLSVEISNVSINTIYRVYAANADARGIRFESSLTRNWLTARSK